MAIEMQFDGLVGPTYNHGGFAVGNLASAEHSGMVSSPRQAALQGLAKMRALRELGVPQAVLPPHFRPDLELARKLGFSGPESEVLPRLLHEGPRALAACYSAASMWTANAATVGPSADSEDRRLHFTPANLQNQLHRSIEAETTARILRAAFPDRERFVVHDPLPGSATLGDEGAANHTRFSLDYGQPGLQLFVYGQRATEPWQPKPSIFPARQTFEASETVARLHRLPRERVVFAQQNPAAIDAGVFHNDVIAVGDRDLLLVHEQAFLDTPAVLAELKERFLALTGRPLTVVVVPAEQVDLDACVATYLFNSQLVATEAGRALICPVECADHPKVRPLLDRFVEDPAVPIAAVVFSDVGQSMHGGGGPACLRLRVELNDEERASMNPRLCFTPALDAILVAWVERHHPDRLEPADLGDPSLLDRSRRALDELTSLLELGSLYSFQRT